MLDLLLSSLLTISMHELSHYLVAKVLKRNPKFKFKNFIFPYVECDNSYKNVENCLISAAPIITHLILGILCKSFLRLINIIFIVIFPISSDGITFFWNMYRHMSNKIKK